MSCNRRGTCLLVAIRPFILGHGSHEPPIQWEASADAFNFKAAGGLDYVIGHMVLEARKLRMEPFHLHIDMEGQ